VTRNKYSLLVNPGRSSESQESDKNSYASDGSDKTSRERFEYFSEKNFVNTEYAEMRTKDKRAVRSDTLDRTLIGLEEFFAKKDAVWVTDSEPTLGEDDFSEKKTEMTGEVSLKYFIDY
jgi:hypothetical protein